MTAPTIKGLVSIFSFGERYGECHIANIIGLRAAILEGVIVMECERIPDTDHEFAEATFSGQTIAHKGLCADAARWLESKGFVWSATDLNYQGGVADVAVPEHRIAIECGYTQASKVLQGCRFGWTVGVMPYDTGSVMYAFSPRVGSCADIHAFYHMTTGRDGRRNDRWRVASQETDAAWDAPRVGSCRHNPTRALPPDEPIAEENSVTFSYALSHAWEGDVDSAVWRDKFSDPEVRAAANRVDI